jgi:ferritin-like metal-binding protein YciE
MRSQSDFWYVLHQLAGELQREGHDTEGQLQRLSENLKNQAHTLRQVNCANLKHIAAIAERLLDDCASREKA